MASQAAAPPPGDVEEATKPLPPATAQRLADAHAISSAPPEPSAGTELDCQAPDPPVGWLEVTTASSPSATQ
ncbi:MAG TPA: hypothetical protein VG366_02020 [Solirubrobacteraceae bacterium]|nr:hypothetical protein [Solirubrobacteraceae bacterium]